MRFKLPLFIVRVSDRRRGKKKKPVIETIVPVKARVTSSTIPIGAKPSDCVIINVGGDWLEKLQSGAAHVDAVHGVNVELPRIPFEVEVLEDEEAAYETDERMERCIRFLMDKHNDHPEMSFAHELGHHLDWWGIGEYGKWVSPLPSAGSVDLLKEWRDAVDNSPETAVLEQSLDGGHIPIIDMCKWKNVPIDPEHIEYLLQRHEQWARSYAQFVAIKTQSPIMLAQLEKLRSRSGAYGTKHWEDKNFQPIEAAMSKLFKQIGWTQ
jgi:hypothetical protein